MKNDAKNEPTYGLTPFPTESENLQANAQWLQGMLNQGRTIIDIGSGSQNLAPSPYYNLESSMVSENSVPVISFSGFK